jgi:ubiquitin-protein ligase
MNCYKLIRFILTSCKVDISINTENNTPSMNIFKISHPLDQKTVFNNIKKKYKNKTHYLFHGSNNANWYSILRNGLKNCSKTKLMTAGAAYGSGIYLSNDIKVSSGYGSSLDGYSYIGIFEVIGEISKYQQQNRSIFVVPDEKMVIQRYLVKLKPVVTNYIKINNFCNVEIQFNKNSANLFLSVLSRKRLIKELKNIIKSKSKYGFTVELKEDDITKWTIYLNNFDKGFQIYDDMVKNNIKHIELEMIIPSKYPLIPPFVRIIYPTFVHKTGYILDGGAICMRLLTNKYWIPSHSLESLIISIHANISAGNGKINVKKKNSYTEINAKEQFIKVARGNNWL